MNRRGNQGSSLEDLMANRKPHISEYKKLNIKPVIAQSTNTGKVVQHNTFQSSKDQVSNIPIDPEQYSSYLDNNEVSNPPVVGQQGEPAWTSGLDYAQSNIEKEEEEYILVINNELSRFKKSDLKILLFELLINKNIPKENIQIFKEINFNLDVVLDG